MVIRQLSTIITNVLVMLFVMYYQNREILKTKFASYRDLPENTSRAEQLIRCSSGVIQHNTQAPTWKLFFLIKVHSSLLFIGRYYHFHGHTSHMDIVLWMRSINQYFYQTRPLLIRTNNRQFLYEKKTDKHIWYK